MHAVIVDNQWIYFENITTPEEDVLWVEFSVVKPGMEYVDPSQLGVWDGVFRKYNRAKKRIARPLLAMLTGICAKHGLPLTVDDRRQAPAYTPIPIESIGADFLPGITLEDFQVDSIKVACVQECGIFDITTGGGKTEIAAGICKAIECPTVILADQTIVIDQIKSRCELRDVSEEGIGVFYSGRRPNGESVVVGSIQSLLMPKPIVKERRSADQDDATWAKIEKKQAIKEKAYHTRRKNVNLLREYVKKADMILVDECDKCASDQWKAVFRHLFRGRRRFGFSGTPFDDSKPVENLVVQEHLGSVIKKVDRRTLEKIGRIIPTTYTMFSFGEHNLSDSTVYDMAYNEHIIQNPVFHQIVVKLCQRFPDDGTLILVDREELGINLVAAIRAAGIDTEFIYGKTQHKHRRAALTAFEERKLKVLIGGKILNRGLDLKGGCENLIIATGGKLRSEFDQKIGRALRHNKRGKSRIFDFYFRCNKYLYSHSKDRLRTVLALGYPATIILPGGSVDGAELVAKRFRLPKRFYLPPAPRLFK